MASRSRTIGSLDKWSDVKYCLRAVKQNGDSLQYVNKQTEEICLEAVKQNGYSLQYVREKETLKKIKEKLGIE